MYRYFGYTKKFIARMLYGLKALQDRFSFFCWTHNICDWHKSLAVFLGLSVISEGGRFRLGTFVNECNINVDKNE